jgi:hypothetical protein
MDDGQHAALFAAAAEVAKALGVEFVGRVELNIFKGGVSTVNIHQTLQQSSTKGQR